MASVPLGRQILPRLSSSCRSSRGLLHGSCLEGGRSGLRLRSGSWMRNFFNESNAKQQVTGSLSDLNPRGVRHQVKHAIPARQAARFCALCPRLTLSLPLTYDTDAVPLAETRRDGVSAEMLRESCPAALSGLPTASSSRLRCSRLSLPSSLRSSHRTLCSLSYPPDKLQPATVCRISPPADTASSPDHCRVDSLYRICPAADTASPSPPAACGIRGRLAKTCSSHEAAAPQRKPQEKQLPREPAVDTEKLLWNSVTRNGSNVFSNWDRATLRGRPQAACDARVSYGDFFCSASNRPVCTAAVAAGFHPNTDACATSGFGTSPSHITAATPRRPATRLASTFSPAGRRLAIAARFARMETGSAVAVRAYSGVNVKNSCRRAIRGSGGPEDAERSDIQKLRCTSRSRSKSVSAVASDVGREPVCSHVQVGEAGSGREHTGKAVFRQRNCRRSVLQRRCGEEMAEERCGSGDPVCSSGRGGGTTGTRASDFCGFQCIPLAVGVDPLPQKAEAPLSQKGNAESVESPRGDGPSSSAAPPQAEETESPLCSTQVPEAPLSGDKLLCVHAADEDSYAAVLLQKIKAESAGWVAGSDLSNCLTDFLLHFKTSVEVPWAVALPLLGAAVRLTTLPFAVSSERDIRVRAMYQEEMTALQKAADKAKAHGFGSPEFKKAQKKLKSFLKKHGLSLIPIPIFQVLLIGLVVSLTTAAIRNISGRSDEFPQFAVEHPAWVESLALPDPTPLTAFVGTYGMLSLIMAGWLVSDKIAKNLPRQRPSSSPFLTRVIPGVVASCVTLYAGIYFPVGAMFMLLPAAGVQAVFTRMFRIRAVERIFNLMPESVKPLHVVYAEALRCRAPKVYQMWQRELQEKNSAPREMPSQILLLWRKNIQRDSWGAELPTPSSVASNGARL